MLNFGLNITFSLLSTDNEQVASAALRWGMFRSRGEVAIRCAVVVTVTFATKKTNRYHTLYLPCATSAHADDEAAVTWRIVEEYARSQLTAGAEHTLAERQVRL